MDEFEQCSGSSILVIKNLCLPPLPPLFGNGSTVSRLESCYNATKRQFSLPSLKSIVNTKLNKRSPNFFPLK